jgi:DNA-binding MarR family transcriptional regulator
MEKQKVLFATLYHYENIIYSIKEINNLETVVLFIDNFDETQKKSFEIIEKITRIGKIKIKKEKLDIKNFPKMIKNLNSLFQKFQEYDIYIDISHAIRIQAIGILTYLSLIYPLNLKKVTYYASWLNEVIEIPIFKADKLNDVEINAIKYISKNKFFMMSDLKKALNISLTHTYRILNKLEEEKYISKSKQEGYKLELKGEIINIVN